MPDEAKPGEKKKSTRTALIVGGIALALGVGFFWWQNRQSGGSSSGTAAGTDATAGVTGSGFTDMTDIIQTVQGPPGKTGPPGPRGKPGPGGDDDDDGSRRKSRCPRGFHYERGQLGLFPPEGSRRNGKGWCVPNNRKPQPGG